MSTPVPIHPNLTTTTTHIATTTTSITPANILRYANPVAGFNSSFVVALAAVIGGAIIAVALVMFFMQLRGRGNKPRMRALIFTSPGEAVMAEIIAQLTPNIYIARGGDTYYELAVEQSHVVRTPTGPLVFAVAASMPPRGGELPATAVSIPPASLAESGIADYVFSTEHVELSLSNVESMLKVLDMAQRDGTLKRDIFHPGGLKIAVSIRAMPFVAQLMTMLAHVSQSTFMAVSSISSSYQRAYEMTLRTTIQRIRASTQRIVFIILVIAVALVLLLFALHVFGLA